MVETDGRSGRGEGGQATPEYIGVVLLVAALLAGILVLAGPLLPGGDLTRAVASKLVCAVRGAGDCGDLAAPLAPEPSPLEQAYGADVAKLIAERTPTISFEDDDFVSLPVDYRECRQRACADSILHGSLEHTQTGLEPTAFIRVVDCRDPAEAAEGSDCSGAAAGNLYVQYWLYYPESWTRAYQRWGFHVDDWESYQVKIGPDGTVLARASSHQGYNGRDGSKANDAGWGEPNPGWDGILGQLHVAAGSHAGMTAAGEADSRRIDPEDLRTIPLEPIAAAGAAPAFEVSPPWEKGVWRDPESTGT